jgi:hypothetical protein
MHLKHRLAETHYFAYDCSGAIAVDLGFGAGRAIELRSFLKKSSKGPASPTSGALKRVKIDRQMTSMRSGIFTTLTDTARIL